MLKTLHLQTLLKSFRRMFVLCCGQRWKHHLLPVTLFWLLTAVPRTGLGHFLGDTKAVLNGCEDHWSLQASMPVLFQITVCVDVRVLTPGPWVAFSYSSVHTPTPELGLEGDQQALYWWLLRVRHTFPLQLSLTNWHRVCLRRDVLRNLFSLEVDGKTVSERTAVAQAIPASGSLRLGCRPWERAPGSVPGEVELYLFRMWADLSSHGPCEDGSLVGWSARYWGLTSARAERRDPNLQCASPAVAGQMFVPRSGGNQANFTTTPAATSTSHMTTQTGSSLVTCAFQQLCSSRDAYFWAVLRVEAVGGDMAEGDVQNLVSDIFSCQNREGFTDFCEDDRNQLQVVQVTCRDKQAIRNTTCDLLLQLSHARPACELHLAAVSALHNSGERRIRVRIQGEVERVGRDLCKPAAPSSGRFVRCTSGSSLDELCQAKKAHKLTCSVIEPDSAPVPQNRGKPCSGQFFAVKIDVNRAFVDTAFLQNLGVYLECRGMPQRLPGCTVMLEMRRPVNICTLDEMLQQLIHRNAGITITQPARRMVVCGPPGLSLRSLLTSNLTWASGTQMSDICQPGNRLLRCDKNEKIGVLLTDSCRPTSQQSSIQSLALATNNLAPVAMTTWPHTAVTLKIVSSSPSEAAQPVVQTVPERTSHNTSSTLTGRAQAGAAMSRPVSLSSLIPVIADIDSTVDTTTVAPEFVLNTVTTAAVFNYTNLNNVTTPTPFPDETPQRTTGATTKSIRAQEEQASKLLDQTRDVSQLNSSQVSQLAEQLGKLLDGPTVSQGVGQMALNIISNLMDGDSRALSASANRLIRAVEDLGVKLVVTGDSEVVSSNSLVLAVKKVDGTKFPPTSVDIYGTNSIQFRGLNRSRSERLGSALGSVFLPPSLGSGLAREKQQQASRVQFCFYTKPSLFLDAALSNQTLVGPVLGSSVANLSISNLTENIEFTIRNINPAQSPQVASCVFWDFSLNGGGGGWSSAGCFLVNATPDYTTCSCDHLTSFAILLDLSRQGLPDHQQARPLTFITYIGCGISAVFLAATLLSYLSFEKLLRDIPAKILVQLCVSLLLLNLLFLLDGWLAQYPSSGLCISTAFFLHYFLLTSFTWAGLEALHMYLSVVQVFLPYLSRYMLKVSLIGWGLPLLVVIVTISVDKDNYGLVPYSKHSDGTSDKFCWLRNDVAFYVGVVAYFLLVFALCLLVFIMVMVQLARIKRQNPHNQSPSRGALTDVRSITGLVILLGLTWGFALFSWGPLVLPFTYLFSIFNSLQGFLVFVFHCAAKENVRRQWRTHLCCGRLRLVENSEWSRTATRSNRTTPVASLWAPHFPSRSSSVISDGTSNGGSVFADSGISDCCSNDVILNEIHRNLPPWREA
ncbi:Adhesion G-protein coupled receptor G2 [Takifugu flavidus]|uniref:Adhesion G-protein coupled receptor G2 n=1 Tax=Takifugu flavidus TaxID=433684 RepID=A0A5C6NV57_9TELE|nr:Adhesion G-protein coupled receptor G2 [Takifugu flavidus]